MDLFKRRTAATRSLRYVAPVLAIAALGLSACSNGEVASDTPGTVPPVWTGEADPSAAAVAGDGRAESGSEGSSENMIEGVLRNASGAEVGTVSFASEGEKLTVTAEVENMTPGFHGFHVHTVGACEPNSVAPTGGEPGNFLSAGGHLQVDGRTEHPSSGDLSSIQVGEDGMGRLVTTTDAITLDDLRAGGAGTSVIVHEGADNFANIPPRYTLPDGAAVPDMATLMTGDAGARAACAVLK
ncbi:superoxide dismutase family protein [Rhodococcus fascians]|uniref:superoxide dismutase[Cu-Zn] n=1 Tax=Rhodococcoides fascians TaxID=1828 RepID=UPI0019609E76|nr:superoxide dismutase family protein [Rhodococcus fascians]MBM7245489.1 superoxide dismutase family protein [Rhodococcus fascians]MBY3811423.1 superoxide dismutase family protein [Rhodococcus fascians]MBY3842767.1 superoxide dismutase family protein [Rhodococcus fascians]MBY3845952.1 superoxide dismutase family protein [Rhodococcus fascians]MBY3851936.1 superoxide dismutase family protein [Rhodococcus fascians]